VKRQHIPAAAGVAALLFVVAWYLVMWAPEGKSLKAEKQAEVQAQAQVVSAQAQLAVLVKDKPKVHAEQKVLGQLVKAVPNGPSLDQLLQTVNQASFASGVTLSELGTPQPTGWGALPGATAPLVPAGQTGPQSISLSVAVGGTKSQLLSFVQALDRQPRIYVVTDLSINSTGQQQVTITVGTFFVNGAVTDPTFPGPSSS